MGHVQEHRLLRSQTMLPDPACRLAIAGIAHACGFEDPSTFSRRFRRRFGCQPRDTREQAQSGSGSPADRSAAGPSPANLHGRRRDSSSTGQIG
jgi:AraC-like DNA-binding protein